MIKLNLDTLVDESSAVEILPTHAELITLEKCDRCGCDCRGANPLALPTLSSAEYVIQVLKVRTVKGPLPDLYPSEGGEYDYVCEGCRVSHECS
jgi:hypothetical protein